MNSAGDLKGVRADADSLTLQWADGKSSRFASIWLRDNETGQRDAHSGQRLIDIADLPETPKIRSASVRAGSVQIQWENDSRGTSFDIAWLAAQADVSPSRRGAVTAWIGGSLNALENFAWMRFGDEKANAARRLQWFTRLLTDGMAFLSEVPARVDALTEAMSLVGRVAETNYGLVFDVRSVAQPENLAYSDLGLGLHTDNPYREPVPGFQALHVLIAAPDGGESLFGDGLALAEHLRREDPESFGQLTTTPVPFHYRSADADLYAERPLIQLSCDGVVTGVHYNNRSIAPLRLAPDRTQGFYAAYRKFALLLRDPHFQLRFRMRTGDLVVFDNQRILHGRTPFSSAKYPRHLRGCYLTRDSVYSEAALLRRQVGEQRA
ncbi:MAG TPA: TauD/TfdA family dioxygenase [Steroidobacteraceae bacterium]|jgi:gamma-butyrobetaine dioxygenase